MTSWMPAAYVCRTNGWEVSLLLRGATWGVGVELLPWGGRMWLGPRVLAWGWGR